VLTKRIVKTHCKQIAIYYAYARAPEFRNERGECIMSQQYEMSVKALKEIASGQRDMGDETATGKSALVGGVVNASVKRFVVEQYETGDGPTGGF
jgi:phage gp36-like protein